MDRLKFNLDNPYYGSAFDNLRGKTIGFSAWDSDPYIMNLYVVLCMMGCSFL